jgi:hypothetical protein
MQQVGVDYYVIHYQYAHTGFVTCQNYGTKLNPIHDIKLSCSK